MDEQLSFHNFGTSYKFWFGNFGKKHNPKEKVSIRFRCGCITTANSYSLGAFNSGTEQHRLTEECEILLFGHKQSKYKIVVYRLFVFNRFLTMWNVRKESLAVMHRNTLHLLHLVTGLNSQPGIRLIPPCSKLSDTHRPMADIVDVSHQVCMVTDRAICALKCFFPCWSACYGPQPRLSSTNFPLNVPWNCATKTGSFETWFIS